MKKLLTLLFALQVTNVALASHAMPAELSWECNGGGNYVFTLKVYNDCYMFVSPYPTLTIDVVGHPAITGFYVNLVSVTDLSPSGCSYDCLNQQPGAYSEVIYQSAPVNLGSYTPPPSGWTFTYSDCTRNSAITNISNTSNMCMVAVAKMFSYNGQLASPCFNNSPVSAEKPIRVITGITDYTFAQTAFDAENDSITYNWDYPNDGFGGGNYSPITGFANGFTYQQPYPGVTTLDNETGIMTMNFASAANMTGENLACVRRDEYRCGVKISSIYREMETATVLPTAVISGNNVPPHATVSASTVTSYQTSVFAGDPVSLNFDFTDADMSLLTTTFQQITLTGNSTQFGTNDTSTTTGCNTPPCATLNVPTPHIFTNTQTFNFNWATDCSHWNTSNSCDDKTTYRFLMKAIDDHCPHPAQSNFLISVTVKGPSITVSGGTLNCSFPAASFQWNLNGSPISGATSSSYTPSGPGIYTVTVLTTGGCSMTSLPRTMGTTGIETANNIINTQLSPNPSHGAFDLRFHAVEKGDGVIRIVDLSGKTINEFPVSFNHGENKIPVDLSSYASGVYELQLNCSGSMSHHKIIIE